MTTKKIEEQHVIVRLVILFYDRSRTSTTIKAKKTFCKNLFHRKNSSNIMLLLCNTHACQASCFPRRSYLGTNSLSPDTMIPSPDSLGWVKINCAWTIPTSVQDMLWL